ncbi:hypothetical protein ACFPM7_28110 [Actinokineospora guangxiensis]|uniref:Uncharacterized protein n=1 Tax=Actinokineospora guangxiensis TaxID=1490288 RepID=A0ABW0EVL5_9PSEU
MSSDRKYEKLALTYAQVGALAGGAGVVVALLSLASDNKFWPFDTNPVASTVMGIVLVIGSAVGLLHALRRATHTLTVACVVLAMVGTGFIVGSFPNAASSDQPKITISNYSDGDEAPAEADINGLIVEPPRPGQSLYILAGENVFGGEPQEYYLQKGPCELTNNGTRWKCDNIGLGRSDANSNWDIVVVGASGELPREFFRHLLTGELLDNNVAGVSGPDPRIYRELPREAEQLAKVTVRVPKK